MKTHEENDEYKELKEEYEKLEKEYQNCHQQLELSSPQVDADITVPAEDTFTE